VLVVAERISNYIVGRLLYNDLMCKEHSYSLLEKVEFEVP